MSSAIFFDLDWSINLSSGNELTYLEKLGALLDGIDQDQSAQEA